MYPTSALHVIVFKDKRQRVRQNEALEIAVNTCYRKVRYLTTQRLWTLVISEVTCVICHKAVTRCPNEHLHLGCSVLTHDQVVSTPFAGMRQLLDIYE